MTDGLDDHARRALRRKVRTATLDALRDLGGEAHRRAIVAKALAAGGFTDAELRAPAPPNARAGCERLIDNLLRWELTNLKRDGLVENPRWSTWRLSGLSTEAEPVTLAEPLTAERIAELEGLPYREYLRTPEWRRTRAAALLRAGNRCMLNADHGGILHVHHNSYDGPRGAESSADLVVLCEECHKRHHRQDGRPRKATRNVSVAPPRYATRPPAGSAPATTDRRPSLLRRLLRAS